MNAKHITELTIEDFRGFAKLELKGLQAVNLIVGQNNAGKTSLLEAITAVAAPDLWSTMSGLFRSSRGKAHERYFKWLLASGSEGGLVAAETDTGGRATSISIHERPLDIAVHVMSRTFGRYHLQCWAEPPLEMDVKVVSVHHISPEALVSTFADAVRAKEHRRLMEQLLNKVDARIQGVQLDFAEQEPFIAVDIGLRELVPLPQLGQGIYRLVAIFAELLGQRPQVCLIDEIENGIHYTAMRQVWRGIAEVSALLGIQVFATTHSKECLEAAQEVFFNEDPDNKRDFAVIQLMRLKNGVDGRVLDESHVETALENDIELR